MISALRARPHLRGGRIDLDCSFEGTDPRPGLKLLRRRGDDPVIREGAEDEGLALFDLAALFETESAPWAKIDKLLFLTTNSPAEGGLVEAELALYEGALGARRAVVKIYDRAAATTRVSTITGVTGVATTPSGAALDEAASIAIQAPSGGVLAVSAGVVTWTATGQTPLTAGFDLREIQVTTSLLVTAPPARLRAEFTTRIGADILSALTFEEGPLDDAGRSIRTITLRDEAPSKRPSAAPTGLEAGEMFCYTLYQSPSFAERVWSTARGMRAEIKATGRHGTNERLVSLLPEAHRMNDEGGQLRRFLGIFGAAFDQAMSGARGLAGRQDVFAAPPAALTPLSRWIGWEPDQTSPSRRRRQDLLFTPEVYSTVGTARGLERMVEHITGWGAEIKEMAHNVFLTNGSELASSWEICRMGFAFSSSGPVLFQESASNGPFGVDSDPAVVEVPAGSGSDVWIFWRSSAPGVREIRYKKVGDPINTSRSALGAPVAGVTDEAPAAALFQGKAHLFFGSDRGGPTRIWGATFADLATGALDGAPSLVSSGPGEDKSPACVVDTSGALRLFWSSKRSNGTFLMTRSGTMNNGALVWSAEQKLTSGGGRDDEPCAVVDPSGDLTLFFSRDFGDHSELFTMKEHQGVWSAPTSLTAAMTDHQGQPLTPARDVSPSAIVLAIGESPTPRTFLIFCSNRGGRWRLWTGGKLDDDPSQPKRAEPAGELHGAAEIKEPHITLTGSGAGLTMHISYRAQRSAGALRSRTWRANDPEAVKAPRPDDGWHYVYDTHRDKNAYYAREAIGVYLTPPAGTDVTRAGYLQSAERVVERARLYVEPFQPLNTRIVWFVEQPPGASPRWLSV